MALVHLSCELRKPFKQQSLALVLLSFSSGALSSPAYQDSRNEPSALDSTSHSRTVATFAQLRSDLLSRMSGSERRLWLVTDYLTDGEIVAGLYIAKYRKIKVYVLLGHEKSTSYMSRLAYLRDQGVSVSLKPSWFPLHQESALLYDDELVIVDSELNFMQHPRKFKLRVGDASYRREFIAAFQRAMAAPMRAQVRSQDTYDYRGEFDGSFNYDRALRDLGPSEGMPRKLPERTIIQERTIKEIENSGP